MIRTYRWMVDEIQKWNSRMFTRAWTPRCTTTHNCPGAFPTGKSFEGGQVPLSVDCPRPSLQCQFSQLCSVSSHCSVSAVSWHLLSVNISEDLYENVTSEQARAIQHAPTLQRVAPTKRSYLILRKKTWGKPKYWWYPLVIPPTLAKIAHHSPPAWTTVSLSANLSG